MPRKVVISGLFFPHGDIKYVENAEDLHIVPCPKLQEMTDQDVEFLRKESMDADLLIVALFGTKIEEVERLGLPDIPAQKVLWAFDSHHCLENDLKYQHLFDKYFIAHSQFVKKFDKVPAYWIPSCYIRFDIDTLKKLRIRSLTEQHRINDVVFPGNLYNLGKRKELIEVIKKYFDRRQFKYHIGPVDPGMPYMNKILQSKVTLNLSLLGDLNIRNFEAWALNRPIITDMVEDFQKLQNVDMSMTYFFKRDFSDFEAALNQALAVKQVKDTSKAVLNNHMLIHRYIEIINISLDTNYYVKNVFGSHSESNINVLGQNSCSEPAQNINSLGIKNSPTIDNSLSQPLNLDSGFSRTQFCGDKNPVNIDFSTLKHIIWLRIDSIGDVVLSNSMLSYLRTLASNAYITVVCQDYTAELFETCQYIDEVIVFNREQMLKDSSYADSIFSKVKDLNADCILNSVLSRNSICDDIIKYSNAPIRIGMIGNLTNCTDQQREERNKHYTHLIKSSEGHRTELEHHTEFIRALGCIVEKLEPVVWINSQAKKFADDWLRDNDLTGETTLILAAGAQSVHEKNYSHYGKALVDICKKNGFSVVALGSKQDFDINQRNLDTLNAAGIRTFNLSGQTTIQQTAAVIDNCRLVVGLDNGLGHIACALEIPNVLILWGKHFGRFHPYSKYSSIVCLPLDCFGCDSKCKFSRMYCVDAVDPQVISHAVRVSLGSPSSKPRVFVQRKELFNPDGHGCPVPSWKMFDGLVNMSSIEVVESPSEKHQSNSQKEPYLSIVVTSRNDDHGGNSLHRMQVFAKGLADQCRRFNLNAELIIVDWNPPAERKSLYEVLEWPLDLGPLTVRFIMVPKEIHNKIDNSDKFGLFQWIAKNVGIKRANGKFILSTNIDILFSDELIQFIASKQLNEDCFYRIDRHDVGCKRIPENLNTKNQLEFCNKNIIRIQGLYGAKSISEISSDHFRYTADDTRLHTNACGDFTLMARDKWHHFRSYPELGKGDLYIDGLIVHIAHVAGLKQVILQEPMRIYHIEHDEGWIARKDKNPIRRQLSLDYNKEYKSWCQKMLDDGCIYTPNGQDWGFASEILKECHVRSIQMGQCSNKEESKHTATVDNSELFQLWIDKFSEKEGRLYYRDQSSESLNVICNLVRKYKPTKIIELGTLSGMSLRTWLASSDDVHVTAVDLSFKSLHKSRDIIPVDLGRVTLVEQDILRTDFTKFWSADDRVIFYVDAHDLDNVPIIDHVLDNAVPSLPDGSIVMVDDMWYCNEEVSAESVSKFFDNVTTYKVDSLQLFEGFFAPYWKGGFFIGFREVVPLLEWVNRHKVELEFVPGDKAVMFRHSSDSVNYFDEKFDKVHFDQQTGVMSYNPVNNVKAIGDDAAAQQANALCQKGIELFAKGKTIQSLECLRKAVSFTENIYGILYAQAACLAKAGQFELAGKLLELELKQKMPYTRASVMLGDIEKHLNKDQEQTSETIGKQKKQGLTIFTIPKAFKGHTEVIQRNAIKSWMAIEPTPEIILLGTDDGTAQVAQEFGLRYVPDIKCNEYGTPLIDDIFAQGQDLASNEIIAYVNADMILFDNFAASAKFIADRKQQFLMIGKRWDVNITDRLDFSGNSWRQYVIDRIKSNGQLHGEFGIDYFVFKNGLWPKIPPFAIGRTTWDNWFVYEAIRLGHPVINVSGSVVTVHQNHDYGHLTGGKKEAWHGPEAQRNLALGGGQSCKRSIDHASLIFKDGKFIETIPLMTEYAQSLLKKGDIAFALKAFRRATEIDPKNIVLHNNYALALQQVGDNDNALKSFSNALKLDSSNRETVLNMHSLYVKMGLLDEAKKLLSTYLQNNSQDKKIIHDSGNKDLEKEISLRGTDKKAPREIVSIPPGSEADKINSVRYARGVGENTGKIFVIPVRPEFMPATMTWPYPAHNDYYGVEQDFLAYLYANNELITHDWRKAKWHYLPVYWQHWMFLNDYGKKNLHLLDAELKRCIVDDTKTFTVCLYSNLSQVHIGRSTLMLPSRNIDRGIDIPLLCTYHKLPQKLPPKRYLANFVGRLSTGDIREQMIENLKGRNDVFLAESETGTERFAQAMLESYIALSPRGYGGDSFRFYEAMQLGTTPFFIGDLDTRPFKSFIDWDQISLYAPDASNVSDIIDSVSKERLMEMGKNAGRVFAEKLCYQKWCAYALKELELIDSGLRQRQEILI